MKKILLLSIFHALNLNVAFGQAFNASGVPMNLAGTSGFQDNCNAAIPTKKITFTVSGVGILSSTNQLTEIQLQLKSNRRLSASCYIKSPDGTCAKIASKMGDVTLYTAQNIVLDYRFRKLDGCLSKQPDYAPTSGKVYTTNNSSNSGIFAPIDDFSSIFNGKDADGAWTIYFGSTASSGELPNVLGGKLTFGTPLPPATYSSAGSSCATAAVWSGTPMCVTTVGKVSTSNRPSTTGCNWLSTSENNLWVAFTPTQVNTCVNISGITNPGGLQSIIVTDNNADGDNNPCTPSNNSSGWTTVSCPRNQIYPAEVGTNQSHNHCFTAVVGQTYYLVVDGNAGTQADFYLTGITGLPVVLPISLLSFDATPTQQGVILNWSTASERNNDYFTISRSSDLENWEEVGTVKGSGNSNYKIDYNFTDIAPLDGISYYQLKQTDYNGENESFDPVSVHVNIKNLNNSVIVYPNPTNSGFDVKVYAQKANLAQISIHSMSGKKVILQDTQLEKGMNIVSMKNERLDQGVYLVKIEFENGTNCMTKLVVE